jgi:hypothetical protein
VSGRLLIADKVELGLLADRSQGWGRTSPKPSAKVYHWRSATQSSLVKTCQELNMTKDHKMRMISKFQIPERELENNDQF